MQPLIQMSIVAARIDTFFLQSLLYIPNYAKIYRTITNYYERNLVIPNETRVFIRL